MFTEIRSTATKDIASLFEEGDFYNSAVIYNLPRMDSSDYTMSYLSREDLVAQQNYGVSTLLGIVLLSVGETCHIEDDTIVRDKEPLEVIQLKNYDDLEDSLSVSVNSNELTSKDIAKTSWQNQEGQYVYNNRGFVSQDN